MKKILFAVALLISASMAHAAPFATADVDAATARCGIYIDGGANSVATVNPITVTVSPARPTGKYCEYDVGTLPNGAHTVALTAISATDVVGRVAESAQSNVVPFTLPLPAAPTAPAVPQNPKLRVTAG